MPAFSIAGVRVAGLAATVPAATESIVPTASVEADDMVKIIVSTGVKSRHITSDGICTSDLCAAAANRLLDRLGWDRGSIDLLLFVTQTPDYILPATACSLHGCLGLAKSCGAFDINLGCSGYVYGLSVAAAHIQAGAAQRVLLLVGDTISKVVSKEDRSVAFLFGDAGSATALERDPAAPPMHFVTGSDGTGAAHLQIPSGMFRTPSCPESRAVTSRENGNMRSNEQLFMNGPEIFNFTIREVPRLVEAVLHSAGWNMVGTDKFVFHQANRFMLEYLAKRMKVPEEKFVLALEKYGNTSSASIPLAICDALPQHLNSEACKIVLAGFGVGFSWAAVAIQFSRPHLEPVFEISSP